MIATRAGRTTAAGIFALLIGPVGCETRTVFHLTGSGGSFHAGGWTVCGERIFVRDSASPGVLFGTRKPDGGDCQISYAIVFRHAARDSSEIRRLHATVRFDGTHSMIEGGVGVGESSVAIGLRSRLEKGKTRPTTESLTVGGEPRDPASGRVFLVDLAANPPTIDQVQVSLPEKVPEPLKLQVVREVAEEILDTLERSSAEFRKFVDN